MDFVTFPYMHVICFAQVHLSITFFYPTYCLFYNFKWVSFSYLTQVCNVLWLCLLIHHTFSNLLIVPDLIVFLFLFLYIICIYRENCVIFLWFYVWILLNLLICGHWTILINLEYNQVEHGVWFFLRCSWF
jgi:hypothetical protein